ncbi:hypothetical protein MATR_06880 [Marivirga tractuosa]|uniref:Uncharacterized protein n=1 Tax=Marivirga tractuosa (strain ATCC 23168 / DSM 4126 / NBRC 15989 / NCIMB 1408 / VKM B-1430 / H-43) TaxID=643867 RepID=E4TQY0_MARTH|nr:hypothetical protein [Marivirga tractuosa]ADR21680.1 hypothetical protein Ftrac_1692 [Marivirga tractuosa DSM 4126]BDD13863.1 hypothetical protein MATR_06880 [Marivirga tractuosa]
MDLRTKLKTRISKEGIENLIQTVNNDRISIEEIIDLLKNRETQFQASWLMTHLVEKTPSILNHTHISQLAKIIENTKLEGLERNIWRILNFVEIPPKLHEGLINLAFEKLEDHKTAVAIQVFSMSVLEKLLVNKMELQLALKAVLELKMERQPTPGLRSRATKIINKINSKI